MLTVYVIIVIIVMECLALQVPPELGSQYSEVLAARDVALYGALCAMASFDRSELKGSVIESPGFREFLEQVPEVSESAI